MGIQSHQLVRLALYNFSHSSMKICSSEMPQPLSLNHPYITLTHNIFPTSSIRKSPTKSHQEQLPDSIPPFAESKFCYSNVACNFDMVIMNTLILISWKTKALYHIFLYYQSLIVEKGFRIIRI